MIHYPPRLKTPCPACLPDESPYMKRITIMIVDDSAFSRGVIGRVLAAEPDLNVIATHANGKEAVDGYFESSPDIILMDVDMPVMNGVEAAQAILTMDPAARIIMCSSFDEDRVRTMLADIGIEGGVDYLAKPAPTHGEGGLTLFGQGLVQSVRALHAKKITRPVKTQTAPISSSARLLPMPENLSMTFPKIIAIGGSTGGMSAAGQVLRDLKLPDHIPVLLTLHIPEEFSDILVRNIQKQTQLPCMIGIDGALVMGGHVYIAPGGKHMIVKSQGGQPYISLSDAPPRNLCRPSVDVMFESILEVYKDNILTVMLTGMGTDGRDACRRMTSANPHNIVAAQDEETSIVWGMPGAVVQAGAAHRVLPLEQIAGFINRVISRYKKEE